MQAATPPLFGLLPLLAVLLEIRLTNDAMSNITFLYLRTFKEGSLTKYEARQCVSRTSISKIISNSQFDFSPCFWSCRRDRFKAL
jgi:hypothetical protein